MRRKRIYILMLLLLCLQTVSAQETMVNKILAQEQKILTYSVKSFIEAKGDLTASVDQRKDSLGRPCALIKMQIINPDVYVNSQGGGEMQIFNNEFRIYVSPDSKYLEVFPTYAFPLKIIFADYGFQHLSSKLTYTLSLVKDREDIVKNREEPLSPYFNEPFLDNKKKADQGDLNAKVALAYKYIKGQGCTTNTKMSFMILSQCAEKGNALAQHFLGDCYYNGIGVKQDYAKAFYWQKRAAERGISEAEFFLSSYYEDGIGTHKDMKEAFKWCKKSADDGYPFGIYSLGLFYESYADKGFPSDRVKAYQYYTKSAILGCSDAQVTLGLFYYDGNIDFPHYATFWFEKAADQGDSSGQNLLGECYLHGYGRMKCIPLAIMYFRLSACQDDAEGEYNLGKCYREGIGVKKSMQDAVKWLKRSAANGDDDAVKELKLININHH